MKTYDKKKISKILDIDIKTRDGGTINLRPLAGIAEFVNKKDNENSDDEGSGSEDKYQRTNWFEYSYGVGFIIPGDGDDSVYMYPSYDGPHRDAGDIHNILSGRFGDVYFLYEEPLDISNNRENYAIGYMGYSAELGIKPYRNSSDSQYQSTLEHEGKTYYFYDFAGYFTNLVQ